MTIPSQIEKREPRYRYYDEAPEHITLPVAELLERIPVEFRRNGAVEVSSSIVELPCRDLFGGNTPRLPLGVLHDHLPDLIFLPQFSDRDRKLELPAGWLALHYRMVTKREELPPEPKPVEPEPISPIDEKISELLATTQGEEKIRDHAKEKESQPLDASVGKTINLKESDLKKKDELKPGLSETKPETDQPSSDKEEPDSTPPVTITPQRRGFFASLPIFRRKAQEGVVVPSPVIPLEVKSEEKKESEKDAPAPLVILGERKEKKIVEATPVKLEQLWKLDPDDILADQAPLQTLFMTEEKLSLDRIIALSGQLPGLSACVLAHGDQVICTSSGPAEVDLRSLSTQAMTMLAQIKESSEKMGLGAVPAITLHADKGVLSFLHHGDLCLLVLHANRGFVPGVRERLQEMLGHLAAAKALPGGASTQATLPI